MKVGDFRKQVIKAYYIDHLTPEEISDKFDLSSSIISKIIYDDASDGFKLLDSVKEEIERGRT